MVTTFINRPCTILRCSAGGEDGHGRETTDETPFEAVCEIQQSARREHADAVADATWTVYLLPGTKIGSGDAIVVDGLRYEVVGDPWPARNPRTQAATHIEATVRRTAGRDDVEEGS